MLSFRDFFSDFSPQPFPVFLEIPLIAPFWDDHVITSDSGNAGGTLYYRFTSDQDLLNEVGANISAAFLVSFSPTVLFVATWDRVLSFANAGNGVSLWYT